MATETLKGIGLFSLDILHLISIGKKESISEIEQHFDNGMLWNISIKNTQPILWLNLMTIHMIIKPSINILVTTRATLAVTNPGNMEL